MTEAKTLAETLHVRREGRTAWITLDRPPLNVMDIPMLHAIGKEVHHLTAECDFLVFRGAGEKGFSTGVEVSDHLPERVSEMLHTFHGVFRQLWRSECLTIAAVHGYCLGGGCELATFCDFVLASESAQFGQPEVRLGCFPPVAMVTLPCLIGTRAAADLILTGRTISAQEALDLGLVTRVVKDEDLQHEVGALLSELRSVSPLVLRLIHRTLWERGGLDLEHSLREMEEIYLQELIRSEDSQEGIRAFLEKRTPVWRGR